MTRSGHSFKIQRGTAWWLRWAVVVLLVVDLISAPLHRHHHDSGVDATWVAVDAGPVTSWVQPHLEGNGEPSLFHATTTLLSEASSAVADDADGESSGATQAVALAALVLALWPVLARPRVLPALRRDRGRPPRPVPLSRPPEGRAPPRRA